MSLTPRRELSILLTVLVLSGAFLFVLKPQSANAFHATSSYNKAQNDTLSSANWNDLFSDFVNTWLPVSLNGPVGIATEAPVAGLKVNGPINAANIFSTGNIGIGTTDPAARLEINPLSGYSILAGSSTSTTFKIGNVASPTENTDVATMGWVNSALESVGGGDSLWGGTKNGSIWNGDAGVGNVGIGTTNPAVPLEVNGMIRSSGLYYKDDATTGINFGTHLFQFFANNTGATWDGTALYPGNDIFRNLGKATNRWGYLYLARNVYSDGTGNNYFIGNVGIGTTTPGAKLHVDGNSMFGSDIGVSIIGTGMVGGNTSGNFTQYFGQSATANAGFGWVYNATPANARARLFTYGYNNPFYADASAIVLQSQSGGNVGIGTTAPVTKLDIIGSLQNTLAVTHSALGGVSSSAVVMSDNSGNLFATTTAALLAGVSLPSGISGQTLRYDGTSWLANSALFNNGTNVGIGTTTPAYKLDVSGNARLYNPGAPTVQFIIGERIGSNNGTFPGIIALGHHNSFAPVNNSYFGKLGRVTFGGNHTDTSMNNILYTAAIEGVAEGTFSSSSTMPTALTFYTGSTGSAANVLNANIGIERMRITNTGNVGIGTTTPGYKLDVQGGQINTSGGLCIAGDCKTAWSQVTGSGGGYWTLNGSNLYASSTSYNVGIGTTNPETKLEIYNGDFSIHTSAGSQANYQVRDNDVTHPFTGIGGVYSTISSNTSLALSQTSDTAGGAVLAGFRDNAGISLLLQGHSNGDSTSAAVVTIDGYKSDGSTGRVAIADTSRLLDVRNGGLVHMSVLGSGNVGIGTTAPVTTLDIIGSLRNNLTVTHSALGGVSSSAVVMSDNSGNLFATTTAALLTGVSLPSGTSGQTLRHNGASWVAGSNLFNNGTDIGIGTTTPREMLDVMGKITGGTYSSSSVRATLDLSAFNGATNGGANFAFTDGGRFSPLEWSVKGTNDIFFQAVPATTAGYGILEAYNSAGMVVGSGGNTAPIIFQINRVEKMRLDSAGSVGIGTATPGTVLDVIGSLRNSLAVTHSALGGVSSSAIVMSDNSGNLFATTTAAVLGAASLWNGTKNGNIWNGDAGVGNVGIGTTAPNEILHVSTNQDTFRSAIFENLSVGTSSQMLLQVRNAADLNSALRFGTLGVNFPTIGSYRQNSGVVAAETNLAGGLSLIARNASGIMTFTTGGYNTERMRITAAGDVGVGTTNPQGKLQVNGSWASTILTGDNVIVKKPDFPAGGGWARTLLSFQEFDGTSYFQIGALGSNNTFTNGYLGAAWDNTTMRWYANKNVVFDGNVGIGTTAPATTLDITGSLRNSLAVTHSALGGVSSAAIVMTDNSGNLFATTTAALLAGVSLPAGTSGQTLRHNGTDWIADSNLFNNSTNVGIGTTAPFRKLSVEGSATIGTLSNGNLNWMPTVGDNQLFLTSVTAAAVNTGSTLSLGGRYRAADNGQIAYASIAGLNETGGEYTNGFMSFYTSRGTESGSNERMRITSTGNVGIGTVAPSTKLDIFTPSISANTNVLTLSTGIYTTTNVEQRLRFWDTRTYELGYIGSGFYTSGGGYVAFGTVDSSTAGLAATEKMRIINNGNVGIGTTDPISKLSLGGQYSDYRNRIALYEHPSGYFRGIGMIHPDSNYGVGIWAKGSTTFPTDANADFVVRDGGNVGIGTTAPATKLDITGSLQNTLAVTHSALGGVSSAAIVMTDNSGNLFATTTASVLGVTGLWNGTKNGNIWNGDAGAGNIGIGTTNPTSKLHIVGGTLGFDNNGIIYASGGSSADISLNTTRSFLVYTGSTVPTFEASVTGGVSIGSYVSSVNMYNVPAGGLIVPGNVGIGTTAPGAPLTVAKIVTAFTDVLMQKWDPLTTNYGLTLSNYNSTGGIDYRFTTLDAGISNPVLTFKQGDVGIGTTNPGANLEVSGAYSGNIFRLTSAGTYSFLQFNEGTASRGYMGFGDNGDIFTGASSDSLSIRAGGDLHLGGTGDNLTMTLKNSLVGIGTIAPVTKLDIIGSLQNTLAVTHSALGGVSSAAIVMTDNSGNLFATTTAALLSGVSLPSGTSGQTLRYDGTSWLANSALFNNGTNVGIGTTNPGKSLQVVGAGMFGDSSDVTNATRALNLISSAAVMRIYRITSNLGAAAPSVELIGSPNANDSATNFTTWWDFYAGAGDKFNIRRRTGNVAQDKLTIDSNGNVGIGTINPLATLHVNGGVNMKHTSVADADYTILASDYIIGYSSITTNRTVTVPDALCTPGRFFVILDESGSAASGKQIIIDPEGATPIVGQTTFNLFAPYNSVYIFCGNSSWFVL